MNINVLQLAPLEVNCVLLNDDSKNLIIIDPGGGYDKIVRFIDDGRFILRMILFTHGHFDHISAAYDLNAKYNAPVYVHKSDNNLLQNRPAFLRYLNFPDFLSPKADNYLEDNQEIVSGDIRIKVLHTPGHTMGSVCFYPSGLNTVFTGDTLFREGIGRTDFPESDQHAILNSIKIKLYTLSDNTVVYPGHGSLTDIGYEKKHNPYIRGGINAK